MPFSIEYGALENVNIIVTLFRWNVYLKRIQLYVAFIDLLQQPDKAHKSSYAWVICTRWNQMYVHKHKFPVWEW